MGGPSKHRRGSRRPRRTRRVRARKLRQRRWRCVTGAADRRRRDRRRCLCQRRAGELCTVRGKAPLLICPGAASRRGLPYGGSARVSWGFNSVARSSGPAYGAAAAVRGPASSGGRLSLCFPDDEASCCGCRGPALRTARSRLTAFLFPQVTCPDRSGGPVLPPLVVCEMRARPAVVVLAWSGDRSPIRGCTATGGDRVPPSDTLIPHNSAFSGTADRRPGPASGRSG